MRLGTPCSDGLLRAGTTSISRQFAGVDSSAVHDCSVNLAKTGEARLADRGCAHPSPDVAGTLRVRRERSPLERVRALRRYFQAPAVRRNATLLSLASVRRRERSVSAAWPRAVLDEVQPVPSSRRASDRRAPRDRRAPDSLPCRSIWRAHPRARRARPGMVVRSTKRSPNALEARSGTSRASCESGRRTRSRARIDRRA